MSAEKAGFFFFILGPQIYLSIHRIFHTHMNTLVTFVGFSQCEDRVIQFGSCLATDSTKRIK